jgi:hypothetical protein
LQLTPTIDKVSILHHTNGGRVGFAAPLCLPHVGNKYRISNNRDAAQDLRKSAHRWCHIDIGGEAVWCVIQCFSKPCKSDSGPNAKEGQQARPCDFESFLGYPSMRLNKPPIVPTFYIASYDKSQHKYRDSECGYSEPQIKRPMAIKQGSLHDKAQDVQLFRNAARYAKAS